MHTFELRPVDNGFELREGQLPEPMIFRDVEPGSATLPTEEKEKRALLCCARGVECRLQPAHREIDVS